jgi:hypothetical protein
MLWPPSLAHILQGFTGHLQGDGYAGYAAMLRNADSRETIVPEHRQLGYGIHIRSKFGKATRAVDYVEALLHGRPFRDRQRRSGTAAKACRRRPQESLRLAIAQGNRGRGDPVLALKSAKLVGLNPIEYLRRAVDAPLRGEIVALPHEIAKASTVASWARAWAGV